MITGLFESSIFPSCVCRYQEFSGDTQVIISLVAYKDTHFSVYNIKMLRKNLSTEDTEGTDCWNFLVASLEIFGGNLFLDVASQEIIYHSLP